METVASAMAHEVMINAARCRSLHQSILKWAFEGRLMDQDPTDEPASVLLDRIRAERTAATSTNTKKRGHRKARSTKA
jgi:type I restriction enzyme S subunit